MQARCFGASLESEELAGVKEVVRAGVEGGVTDRGLSVIGFLYLHHLFVLKGRLETTWTVLRHFHYDDSLNLPSYFLNPSYVLTLPVPCINQTQKLNKLFMYAG